MSDGEVEWDRRCLQLVQYVEQHGDAHVGYRDNEDADLVRWARKQRHAHKKQTLEPQRFVLPLLFGLQLFLSRKQTWFSQGQGFQSCAYE